MNRALSLTLPLPIRLRLDLNLILKIFFILTIPLLAFYLFQVGNFVKGNYLMKNYEQELKELANQNLTLQGEASNVASLGSLEEKVREFNFVKVSEVKYIPISSDYLVID